MKYTALDLFCGCGGMSLGLEQAGIKVVAGIDIWDKAIESYTKNHTSIGICMDIRDLHPAQLLKQFKIKEIDIIAGGPPCQGFSMAGKRDKNDPRNSLFMNYVEYLDYYKPKVFIFENVMGILSMKLENGTKAIDTIMDCLGQNYNCVINTLYASDFDVPQKRRRVIIIGVRKDLNLRSEHGLNLLPAPIQGLNKPPIPVSSVLLDQNEVDKRYFLSKKAIDGINAKKNRMKEKGHGFGAQFLDLNKPSFTIPARYWKDGYDALVKYDDKTIRRLTEIELKRIQTFPSDYNIVGTKKDVIMQIGNAVPCRLAYYIGNYVVDLLESI